MQSALESALEQTRAAGGRKLCTLRLRVGALSGAVPDALSFAFEALTGGTEAEGATLQIEEVPARFYCESCREEFESESLLADCPRCSNLSRDLRSGRELQIASLEIE